VLDTLYNIDEIDDRSDLLRLLEARRHFSDLNMALAQRAYLDRPHQPAAGNPPPGFVKAMIKALSILPGDRGRAVRDTLELLGLEDLTASIFTRHATERMGDPEVRGRILRLHRALTDRLRAARAAGSGPDEGPGLWVIALDVAGSPEDAVELLGVFTTQHRTLAKTVLPRLPTREAQLPLLAPLARCASNFFLVQELNETTRAASGVFTFSYPDGHATDNRRFYHFWSEAFIGHSLRRKGYDPEVVGFVTGNLGRAYETYTLPLNIRFALKSDAKVLPLFGGWREDVRAHRRGAAFGMSLGEP